MGEADTTELLRAILWYSSPWRLRTTDVGRPDYYRCRCCGVTKFPQGEDVNIEVAQKEWNDSHLAWCAWSKAAEVVRL